MKTLTSIILILSVTTAIGQNDIWKVYNSASTNLPENKITALIIDKNNNKWIGTKKGLLSLSDESWKVYTQENSGLPHNTINCLTADDYDRIWIGTQEGISSFDGVEWKLYKATKKKMNHYSIYIDENDNKWIGTEKALLVLNQDGVNEKTLTNKSNLAFEVINNISKNNTKFSYYLPIASKVSIKLYTFQGKEITTIFEEKNLKGQHHFYYNTRHLSSGTYFCQFRTNERKQAQKIVVMK